MRNQRRWPAEWETHALTWMAWPCRSSIWDDSNKAYKAYADVANAISNSEPVKLMIDGSKSQIPLAKKLLSSEIELIDLPLNDSWARDSMALFVYDRSPDKQTLIPIDWKFNAWGEKFKPYHEDQNQVNYLADRFNWQIESTEMVLEGGSIHSNGNGTLLTTQECLIEAKRNPNLTQDQIQQTLFKHLNCETILWLPYGIANDTDTDGHIDNVACFINHNTILLQSCYNVDDANYLRHQANLNYLKNYPYEIIELPQPKTTTYKDELLALSYLNFYITNDQIIMPVFNQTKEDATAVAILQECFPRHKVTPIDSAMTIATGGGGIHCITMQQPQGVIRCA
ncbi:agmatine deiminase family protein [Thiotrichales bacterium 19S3-7]|nr:agmatine deiminase family protein [Thiotrichales bacterium 19S3-7]MCF6802733.1 agmatine deiminase family protein [Thiotrichales bacterium 19S3-11]